MLSQFKKFILRGNAIDLAVAVVIGAAFNAVVQSLVKDIITPLLAAIGGRPNFAALYFTINGSKFTYGEFLNALVSFIIMAVVIFFLVVTPLNEFNEITSRSKKTEDPTTKKCPYCLSEINAGAIRCPLCTSKLDAKLS